MKVNIQLYLFLPLELCFVFCVLGNIERLRKMTETLKTKPGRKVEMKCLKHKADDHLYWFFKKDNISDNEEMLEKKNVKFERLSHGKEEILILTNPNYSDEGIYILKSFGVGMEIVCKKYLEILSAPIAICKSSLNMPIKRGSDVTLICSASRGNPAPTITWFRVEHHTFKKTLLVNTHTLTLQAVREYASGIYECNLHNDIGEDSCRINLSVKFKPEIELYETKIELREIQNTTLMCRVTANPMAPVVWTRDNNTDQLYTNEKYDIKEDRELIDTHYTKYLILTLNARGLKANMFGVYWCRITGYDVKYARKVEVIHIQDDT